MASGVSKNKTIAAIKKSTGFGGAALGVWTYVVELVAEGNGETAMLSLKDKQDRTTYGGRFFNKERLKEFA